MTEPPGRMRRKIVQRLLYAAYLLVVVALVLEVALALGLQRTPLYEMREKLAAISEAARERPVAFILGDSFVQPAPPAYGLGALLQDHLAARGYHVQNLAQGGTAPPQYWQQLHRYREAAAPRFVILDYYVGNDLTGTLQHLASYREELRRGPRRLPWERSHLASWLGMQLGSLRLARSRGAIAEQLEQEPGALREVWNPYLRELGRTRPSYLVDNLLMEGEALQEAWRLNREILLDVHRQVRAGGGRVLFTIAPRSVQIDESHFDFFRRLGFEVDSRFLSTQRPQDRFMALCAEHALECLDMLPAFRVRAGEPYYLENDDHWSPPGAAFALELVAAKLDEMGIAAD